ncbi:hypothetical protein KEM54_004598 [Ascosphaera aggregata]|nr:hypothetical protein KEM54_004598 [Ascosphaera aggregata]
MDANENDELYPIAVLIDELKAEDVVLRLNAIHRLSTIALALGPERTRDELIPFLDDSVEDEDEVLTALSEELGGFVEYVGGPEHAHVLLSPLENLAAIEEPLVREKAVESLNKICTDLSPPQTEAHFLPLIHRLSKADWFTSRISATGLFATPYTTLPHPSQAALRTLFAQLVHDDTPMVRRQAANNLARFVNVMGVHEVVQDVVPMFHFLASDDQDSVRLLTVEVLVAIAEKVGKEEQAGSGVLLAALRSLFEDRSWRVRYMVADKFEKIANAVNHEVLKRDLVPAFVRLLKDTEAEVRTAISGQIPVVLDADHIKSPGFCRMLDKETLLNEVMTSIEDLVSDQSQHVRAALGTQISGLAPILGKQETIQHLLPMFLTMLKDEFPDVRLHIISKLDLVNKVIGIDLLSQSLLPAIVQLAEDKQWRVRLAIIEYIPLLASQLGVRFFDDSLSSLCMGWLGDAVFSIRDAATQNLKKLTEVFGVEWARQSIIPKVVAMGHHPNYLYRMTTCFAISTLAPVVDGFTIQNHLLPILEQLSQDLIPNIRFNVAKTYGVLIDTLRCLPNTGTLLDLEKKGALPPGTATATVTLTTGKVAKSPASGPLAVTTLKAPEEDPLKKLETESNKQSRAEDGSEWKCKEHAELVQDKVLPNLKRLETDDDVDVRYYAATAAAKAGGIANADENETAETSTSGSGENNNSITMELSP